MTYSSLKEFWEPNLRWSDPLRGQSCHRFALQNNPPLNNHTSRNSRIG